MPSFGVSAFRRFGVSALAELPFFPDQSSTFAPRVDALFFFLIGVAGFFSLLICVLIVVFAVRYRRRPERPRAVNAPHANLTVELVYSGVPLLIALGAFAWGAELFVDYARPPADARHVYVVGKQWMWKVQHPEGQRELNQLHVPRGHPVRLTLASDDVIHSFFVPAFRVKQDAVPGRYTTLWFEPTRTGRFHLFCAEYCGTNHSRMIGEIVVLEPEQFQSWLSGGADEPLPQRGRRLFEQYGCHTCHSQTSGARGPDLAGLIGKEVLLESGRTVIADEAYLRESILSPAEKIVAGYEPIMPTFAGQLDEEAILAIIAHIRSMEGPAAPAPGVLPRPSQEPNP